jgi:hypothetical protein
VNPMWNNQQVPMGMPHQMFPWQMMLPQGPQIPLQVITAFRLLDNLDHKQHPLVAVNDISIEEIQREKLLPIEEEARATALHVLMAYMRSALQ